MKSENIWLNWAMELQSLAQAGLFYGKDVFDRERYTRIREISAEMLSHMAHIPVETVTGLFCNEIGYQTPKIDTRAAVFQDGKILLVKERDGRWSLPGGLVRCGSVRGRKHRQGSEGGGWAGRGSREGHCRPGPGQAQSA